jgi:hypothetical protein
MAPAPLPLPLPLELAQIREQLRQEFEDRMEQLQTPPPEVMTEPLHNALQTPPSSPRFLPMTPPTLSPILAAQEHLPLEPLEELSPILAAQEHLPLEPLEELSPILAAQEQLMVKTILQLQGWAEELREATPYPVVPVIPLPPREDRMEKAILQLQEWSRGLKVEIQELTPAEEDAILEGVHREDDALEEEKKQVLLQELESAS